MYTISESESKLVRRRLLATRSAALRAVPAVAAGRGGGREGGGGGRDAVAAAALQTGRAVGWAGRAQAVRGPGPLSQSR